MALLNSLALADVVFVYAKNLGWDVAKALEPIGTKTGVFEDLDAMVKAIVLMSKPRDQILVMSNGGFGGVRKDFGGAGGAGRCWFGEHQYWREFTDTLVVKAAPMLVLIHKSVRTLSPQHRTCRASIFLGIIETIVL